MQYYDVKQQCIDICIYIIHCSPWNGDAYVAFHLLDIIFKGREWKMAQPQAHSNQIQSTYHWRNPAVKSAYASTRLTSVLPFHSSHHVWSSGECRVSEQGSFMWLRDQNFSFSLPWKKKKRGEKKRPCISQCFFVNELGDLSPTFSWWTLIGNTQLGPMLANLSKKSRGSWFRWRLSNKSRVVRKLFASFDYICHLPCR